MKIGTISKNPISFTYSSILKKLYKEGKLPSVVFDIYGIKLSPKTVSLEHNIPKSLGGKSKLFNYSLADKFKNEARGNDDLLNHTTIENITNWFKQFKDIKLKGFDGESYIKSATENLKQIGINIEV